VQLRSSDQVVQTLFKLFFLFFFPLVRTGRTGGLDCPRLTKYATEGSIETTEVLDSQSNRTTKLRSDISSTLT
jgi:hypothetical protein